MSGGYRVPIAFTAQTAQVDLLEATAHATRPLTMVELHLSQSTEVGDAQEEQLVIQFKSGQTTSGSGGNSVTPLPNDAPSGLAAGFVAETHNTTKASGGTIVTHGQWAWNVRGPLDLNETDLGQVILASARRMTVELATTPADSVTIGGYAVFQEVGS